MKETAAECRDGPAEPDGPAEAAEAGGEYGNNDTSWEEEDCDGEDVEPGLYRGSKADGCKVEGNVIEGTEELHVNGMLLA